MITRQIFVVSLLLCSSYAAFASQQVHPAVERIGKQKTEQWDDFEFPYSICQTIRRFDFPIATLRTRVRSAITMSALPFAAHFSSAKLPQIAAGNLVLPAELETTKGKEGLKKCTLKKCFPKLQNETEKQVLIAATDKQKAYHQILFSRVEAFLKSQYLSGYEERRDNRPAIKAMLGFFPYFKSWYPQSFAYFHDLFWKEAPPQKWISDSVLRARTWVLGESILEPIYWISEVFRIEEGGAEIYIEIPIYSNHYFDSWIRFYELLSDPKKPQESLLALTDIMEIDELKKSSLIRMLYRGKMSEAIFSAQKAELTPLVAAQ